MQIPSQTLNPYQELFGIVAERPNYYELLGLPAFTDSANEIRMAAGGRLSLLEPPPSGIPAAVCQKIAHEILAARDCLSNTAAKDDYDVQLRRAILLSPQQRSSSASSLALGGNALGAAKTPPSGSSASRTFREGPPQTRPESRPAAQSAAPSASGPTPAGSMPVLPDAVGAGAEESLRPHPNYESAGLLAKGRCTKVFLAFERTLRRKVAIKQLDRAASDQQIALFWREAQFLASHWNHNIVTILGSDEQRCWIITELMAGNVESNVASGPMDPDLVRAILRQALDGLAHFHRQGQIHGEIKPANLLIDNDGYIKLNASPGYQTSDEFRAPLGSQRHVAPELLNPKVFGDVGPAVDFYCLGFTMLELLVGPGIENLFRGVSGEGNQRDIAWLRWHHSHTETLPSLRQLVPGAPDDLVAVLDRLVAKRVSDRFHSAEEALDALDKAPLLRVPLDGQAGPSAARKQGPGAMIKGKPPAHREFIAQQEKSRTLLYRISNSPYVAMLRDLWKRRTVRYVLGAAFLVVLLLILLSPSGPGKRRVKVLSEPTGAMLTIDNQAGGIQTPRDVDLTVGHHVLEFDLPGYETSQLAVDVPAQGDVGVCKCLLVPIKSPSRKPPPPPPGVCLVSILSVPSDAAIKLDGSDIPAPGAEGAMRTPGQMEMAAGSYVFELSADGYKPLKRTVEVRYGKENSFTFHLDKLVKPQKKSEEGGSGASIAADRKTDPVVPPRVETKGGEKREAASRGPRDPVSAGSARPRANTRDKLVPYDWKLSRKLADDERKRLFEQVIVLLNDSWVEATPEALENATAAFKAAEGILPGDSRVLFIVGITRQGHSRLQEAKEAFAAACAIERKYAWQCEQDSARGIAPDCGPFPAAWRQLIRVYLAERRWESAAAECDELLRYCVRCHKAAQRLAARGVPAASGGSTFDVLHENVRFAGHAIGYIKQHGNGSTHFHQQPLGRFAAMLESQLVEDAYRDLLHNAIDEAAAPATVGSDGPTVGADGTRLDGAVGGPLEDLAFSLELERNLMFRAIEEECIPLGIDIKRLPAKSRPSYDPKQMEFAARQWQKERERTAGREDLARANYIAARERQRHANGQNAGGESRTPSPSDTREADQQPRQRTEPTNYGSLTDLKLTTAPPRPASKGFSP